jgi:hypothetical protein
MYMGFWAGCARPKPYIQTVPRKSQKSHSTKTGGKTVWRASLESGLTGDRNGFPDLEALFTFLEQILQEMNPDENVPVEGGKEQNPGGE